MAFMLAGKKILVTGAGRGIGRELSKTLSEHGCKVYAVSRTKDTLDSLAAESSNIYTIQADIGNWDETWDKLKDIEVLDGLVNNAAYIPENQIPSLDVSKAYLDKTVGVNLFGTINITQIVGRKMVAAGKPGSIVNVSGVLAMQAFPGCLPYTMTKCAVDMVTKQFALELGPHKIRVNSVNPTLVLTNSVKDLIANRVPVDRIFCEKSPSGRSADLKEIVFPLLYLLSDYSSMVSGTTNIIDGGMLSSFVTKM